MTSRARRRSRWASPATGWVRLAHLSPNTPPVDVYLYYFGDPTARLAPHHVSYGTVSPYQQVPPGDYTVSMRAAGATPKAKPVLSTGFWVGAGDAYTVAGWGPRPGCGCRSSRTASPCRRAVPLSG